MPELRALTRQELSAFNQTVPLWGLFIFDAYIITFMVITGIVFLWSTARKKDRPPEKFKLLRGPGETQRRRVQKSRRKSVLLHFWRSICSARNRMASFVVSNTTLQAGSWLLGARSLLVVFVAGTVCAIIVLLRFLNRRRNDLLGYLGERAVAEHLEALTRTGYRIFHDVPCEGRKKNFNIDHVVVGPTGVAAIEVKTRRKKKGPPRFRRTRSHI